MLSGLEIPDPSLSENPPQLVAGLVKNHARYALNETNILSAERFGRKLEAGSPNNRAILVKFHTKKLKVNVVTATVTAKPPDFYENEYLTREVNDIYRDMRKL